MTQISAGFFLALVLGGQGSFPSGLGWAALICGALGLAGSVLHLGRPQVAWRAFLGWRRSWLSREILAFNGWAGMAAGWALGFVPLELVAVAGLAAVFTSVMVYVDTRRPFWSPGRTGGRFFGTVALACIGGVVALGTVSPLWFAAGLALKGLIELRDLLTADSRALDASRQLLRGPLRQLVSWRFGLLLLAAVLAVVAPGGMPVAMAAVCLGLLGEFGERACFFRAVQAPKMPGGV